MMKAEKAVRALLTQAGITVDGNAPYDIQVHDPAFYTRLLRDGSLGLGEAHVDGQWDSPAIDQTITKLLMAKLNKKVQTNWRVIALVVKAKLLNLQVLKRASEVGLRHYDLGNDLYEAMLGPRLAYTCAYYKDAETLDEAQEAKLDLVCKKIGLKPGMKVLDLGCGWASFAKFAAEKYDARVTGITISKEQAALGSERCRDLPVEIIHGDYREARGLYDAVISIGIMEHIGPKNYKCYIDVVDRCLKPNGIAFIHTISGNREMKHTEPWLNKYIFFNAVLPTIGQINVAMDDRFVFEDIHNFGPDYDRTLMAWYDNFIDAWPSLRHKYGDRFFRMWSYYLLVCAAGFRARHTQLYQMVLTRPGTPQPNCRLS